MHLNNNESYLPIKKYILRLKSAPCVDVILLTGEIVKGKLIDADHHTLTCLVETENGHLRLISGTVIKEIRPSYSDEYFLLSSFEEF